MIIEIKHKILYQLVNFLNPRSQCNTLIPDPEVRGDPDRQSR